MRVSAKNIVGPRSARAVKAGASAALATALTVEISLSKTKSTLHWVGDGASVGVAGQEAEKVVNYRTSLLRQADQDTRSRRRIRSTTTTTLRYSILQRLQPLLLLYYYDSSATPTATNTVVLLPLLLLQYITSTTCTIAIPSVKPT